MTAYDDAKAAIAAALIDTRTTYIKPTEIESLVVGLTDALQDELTADETSLASKLSIASNLSDLASASTAITNLGLIGMSVQAGTSYTVSVGDQAKLVTFSNTSAVAVTLPIASDFGNKWFAFLQNLGGSLVTITPTTSTIDGSATFDLHPRQGILIVSDGSNYATFRGYVPNEPVNAQTGTTYTFLTSDVRKLVTFSNGSSIAATLPQAGAATFYTGWYCDVQNRGAGTLTITPTTSTIDGAASLALTTRQGVRIVSDGTNYFTQRGHAGTAGTDFQAPVTAALLAAFAFGPFTSIASASTTDLSTVATIGANITGTTGITSFGTGANLYRVVKFAGVLTITHNATSLILPNAGNNITTAAGDRMGLLSDASGNWTAVFYQRADGTPLVGVTGTTASQAESEAGTDNTKTMTPLRVAQAIQTQVGRNFVVNGSFEVWQRGAGDSASISVAASTTAYTADRWYLKTGTNQAHTVANVTGIVTGSGAGARVQRTASQTGTGTVYFAYPLTTREAIRLRGAQVVLSFSVSAGANWSPTSGTLTYNLYTGTNTQAKRNSAAYTGEANPLTGSTNLTPGGGTTRVISSLSSALGSSIQQAEVQFSWAPTGTAGAADNITLDDLQLEVVTDGVAPATPVFERVPFDIERVRCMTHFRKSFDYNTAPAQNVGASTGEVISIGSVNQCAAYVPFDPPMIKAPTMTTFNTSAANSNWNNATIAAPSPTVAGVRMVGTSASDGTTCGIHYTADAGI